MRTSFFIYLYHKGGASNIARDTREEVVEDEAYDEREYFADDPYMSASHNPNLASSPEKDNSNVGTQQIANRLSQINLLDDDSGPSNGASMQQPQNNDPFNTNFSANNNTANTGNKNVFDSFGGFGNFGSNQSQNQNQSQGGYNAFASFNNNTNFNNYQSQSQFQPQPQQQSFNNNPFSNNNFGNFNNNNNTANTNSAANQFDLL